MAAKNNNDNGFSARLKKLRMEKALSQIELAEKLCVHPNNIGRYERGESRPNTKFLKALADFFDISVDYLYDGIEMNAAVADLSDKRLVELFKEIDILSEEEKDHIKFILESVIKNKKHQQLAY